MTLILSKFTMFWPFMTLDFRKFGVKYGLAVYDVNFQKIHYVWPFMTFMKHFFVFLQLPSSTTCMRGWIVITKLFVTSSSGFFGWLPSYGSSPIIHCQTIRNSWIISSAKPKRPSMMEHPKSQRRRHQHWAHWRWRSSPRRRKRRIEEKPIFLHPPFYFWKLFLNF